jgi:hypothetical protein
MRRARCISRVIMVTRFAWMAQRFLRKYDYTCTRSNLNTHASSNKCTRNASLASCNARIAELCQRRPVSPYSFISVVMSSAISRTCRESVGVILGYEERTTYDARKGELAQEQVRAFLVLADLAKGDGTWSVPTLLRSWFVVRSGFSTLCDPSMPPRVNASPSREKAFYTRCLDGPGRLSSSPASSPSRALRWGSRPPVDLRAVLVTLPRFGAGGVESCGSMASVCLRFCFL